MRGGRGLGLLKFMGNRLDDEIHSRVLEAIRKVVVLLLSCILLISEFISCHAVIILTFLQRSVSLRSFHCAS